MEALLEIERVVREALSSAINPHDASIDDEKRGRTGGTRVVVELPSSDATTLIAPSEVSNKAANSDKKYRDHPWWAAHSHTASGLSLPHLAVFVLRGQFGAGGGNTAALSSSLSDAWGRQQQPYSSTFSGTTSSRKEGGSGGSGDDVSRWGALSLIAASPSAAVLVSVWRVLARGGVPVLTSGDLTSPALSCPLRLPYDMRLSIGKRGVVLPIELLSPPSSSTTPSASITGSDDAAVGCVDNKTISPSSTTSGTFKRSPASARPPTQPGLPLALLRLSLDAPWEYAQACDTLALSTSRGEGDVSAGSRSDVSTGGVDVTAEGDITALLRTAAPSSTLRLALTSKGGIHGGAGGCTPQGLLCAITDPHSAVLRCLLGALKGEEGAGTSAAQRTRMGSSKQGEEEEVTEEGVPGSSLAKPEKKSTVDPSSEASTLVLYSLDFPVQLHGGTPGGSLLLHLTATSPVAGPTSTTAPSMRGGRTSSTSAAASSSARGKGGNNTAATSPSTGGVPSFWYRGVPVDRGLTALHRRVLADDHEAIYDVLHPIQWPAIPPLMAATGASNTQSSSTTRVDVEGVAEDLFSTSTTTTSTTATIASAATMTTTQRTSAHGTSISPYYPTATDHNDTISARNENEGGLSTPPSTKQADPATLAHSPSPPVVMPPNHPPLPAGHPLLSSAVGGGLAGGGCPFKLMMATAVTGGEAGEAAVAAANAAIAAASAEAAARVLAAPAALPPHVDALDAMGLSALHTAAW